LSRLNRILLIIVIVLAAATAVLWFKPDILSSLSALNPFGSEGETIPITTGSLTAQPPRNSTTTALTTPGSVANAPDNTASQEDREEVLSPLEKEIQQRHESYQTKIYTYEPYEPLVMRNPFQRMVSSVYLEEEEEKLAGELATEEDVRRFVQPELPPETKFTGIISAGETKLAIIEMDDETYIVKEGDLILDKYLIKSITDEKVVIDINGFEISLQLGGGEATND
jgi:Tfp pilus assembly protein PilP